MLLKTNIKSQLFLFQLSVGSLFICTGLKAQVAIGKNTISSPSISLEFGNENRGIILPWVINTPTVDTAANNFSGLNTGAEVGTLIFDSEQRSIRLKTLHGWQNLSPKQEGKVDTSLQDDIEELSNAKVSIGAPTKTPGILVLEDQNKAMVLPKVASPHLNIINPEPGTIVYDTATKQLAIFNGKIHMLIC